MNELLLLLLGIGLGAALIWFLTRRTSGNHPSVGEQFNQFQHVVGEELGRLRDQLDRRLAENARAMDDSKNFLAGRVSDSERTARAISSRLGQLDEAVRSMHQTNTQIANFQQMLTNPKIRGSFGEVLLTNLLSEVLPTDRFQLQYAYQNREIADAIIHLQDGYIVAIDAKFPLSNYQQYQQLEDEDQAQAMRKNFIRDVKKHITDISKKYISSQEKTLDYAFMYIPVEGVYYETMVKDADGTSLWEFCLKHRIIPVSPNSLLAYLQTVLVGLRGMKVEQQAREILTHLGQLRQDFNKFADDFATVGSHLNHAKNRYDHSARRLDRFTSRLEQIETTDHAPKLAESISDEK